MLIFFTARRYFNSEQRVNRLLLKDIKNFQPDEKSIRTGIIAKKVGMTGLFDKWGVRHGLTVLQVINSPSRTNDFRLIDAK